MNKSIQLIMLLGISFVVNAQKTWRFHDMKVQTQNNYNDIVFASDDVGFIVGDSGLFLETFNGGKTWNQRSEFDKTIGDIHSIIFESDSVGFFSNGFHLYRTDNQGKTWERNFSGVYNNTIDSYNGSLYSYGHPGFESFAIAIHAVEFDTFSYHYGSFTTYHLERVKLISDSTLVVLKDSGRVYRSTDLGKTIHLIYEPQDLGFTDAISQSIEFISPDTGFITYNKDLALMTTDGGLNWSVDTSKNIINSSIDPTTGILSMVQNQLYRCTPIVSFFSRAYVVEKYNRANNAWELLHNQSDFFGTKPFQNKGHLHGTSKSLFTPLNGQLLYLSEDSLTTSIRTIASPTFAVYPNPTRGYVFINADKIKDIQTLQIHDFKGALIEERNQLQVTNRITFQIDTKGIYSITLITADGMKYTQRLIVN